MELIDWKNPDVTRRIGCHHLLQVGYTLGSHIIPLPCYNADISHIRQTVHHKRLQVPLSLGCSDFGKKTVKRNRLGCLCVLTCDTLAHSDMLIHTYLTGQLKLPARVNKQNIIIIILPVT